MITAEDDGAPRSAAPGAPRRPRRRAGRLARRRRTGPCGRRCRARSRRRRRHAHARGDRAPARATPASRSSPRRTTPRACCVRCGSSGPTSRSSTSACRRPTPTRGSSPTQRIRAEHPEVGVLVLSQYVEPSYALRLLEEHPERVGYLLKERVFDVAVLVDALRRIADGETVVDPTIVARLFGRRRREDPLAELTDARARGARPRRRGTLEPRDRGPPVRHRAHRRGARQAGLPQARARR